MVTAQSTARDMFRELMSTPISENIQRCFQCGACTGTCTVTPLVPEFNPRQYIHLVQTNDVDNFLKVAHAAWRCVGCYKCSQLCPRQINPAEIMEALGTLVRKRFPEKSSSNQNTINDAYHDQILANGRLNFPQLYVTSKLKTGRFMDLLSPLEVKTAMKMVLSPRLSKILALGKPSGWDRVRKVLKARLDHS
jgi:heterodisulfide reductase subunit C